MAIPALDRLLSAAPIDIQAFAVCEIGQDAELLIDPLPNIEVHYVLAGTLHLTIEGASPVQLRPGTIVVAPPHRGQRLAGSATVERSVQARLACSERSDGLDLYDAADGARGFVRLMCSQIHADLGGRFGLFEGMTNALIADLGDDPLIQAAFATMLVEADRPGPYSHPLSGSLMKACLVLMLRHQLIRSGTASLPAIFQKSWLAGVVACILEDPAAGHSVVSLAAISGRSRSTFARDFTLHIGTTPMEFVTQARLALGRERLADSHETIGSVALGAGFASRSHFSRLFKQVYGIDPTSFRQQRKEGTS